MPEADEQTEIGTPHRVSRIDPVLRVAVAAESLSLVRSLLRAALLPRGRHPQVALVLALADALATLALLFGEPSLIETVADEARRALRDVSVSIDEIFPGETT